MLTLGYSQFSARLSGQAAGKRVPLKASVEVTHRCPLTCSHCYNNLPMGDGPARRAELSLAEHQRLADDLAEAGCLWLLYTGGEIFARKDFLDIYRHARGKGFLITLFTNGTLITPAVADALAALPPFAIEITLYGATAATYEALTGVSGSHARCLRGIDLLLERGLPLALKTVALSINRHELPAMRELARARGVAFKFDAMVNPRTDCSASPLAVRLRPEEVVALDLEDPRRASEWRAFAGRFDRSVHTGSNAETVYHCGGGVNAFAVDPYGGLSICVLSQQEKYDLRQGSFAEGWGGFLGRVRTKKRTMHTRCVPCGIKTMCGMCPAQGELESGHPERPVEFLCEVAHLRARTLDIPVPPHGECAYCEGGDQHGRLQAAAAHLQAGGGPPPPAPAPAPAGRRSLTVLRDARSGGCGSCASEAS